LNPYGQLLEALVRIRGIPPKWCMWKVFAQITSGLIEVDDMIVIPRNLNNIPTSSAEGAFKKEMICGLFYM
jgi:hypothetical protein